jgi:hypothetical protein
LLRQVRSTGSKGHGRGFISNLDCHQRIHNPQFNWTNDGSYQVTIEDGTWMVQAIAGGSSALSDSQFTVSVSGGVVLSVKNDAGETVTATNGIFILPLKTGNLVGAISSGNVLTNQQYLVRIQQSYGAYYGDIASKWVSGSNFGFFVNPGTYRVVVEPYWQDPLTTNVARTQVDNCVVPITGSVTCNVVLASPNFKGKVLTPGSDVFRSVYAYLYVQNDQGISWYATTQFDQWLFQYAS